MCRSCSSPGVPAAGPRAPHQSAGWSAFFAALDWVLKRFEPFWPKGAARSAPSKDAGRWTTERLNGEDGLGAIYPAMANSVMMYDVLGYPPEHPDRAIARKSVENLLVVKDDEAYCQPCVSPVWDTALVAHALMEARDDAADAAVAREPGMAEAAAGAGCEGRLGRGAARCAPRRLGLPVPQRSLSRPGRHRRGGDGDGPGQQQRRASYDDAHRARRANGSKACRAENGGWGAFDADNIYYYLNNIPFADHGALLDPPTEDVSGRCVGMLAQLGATADDPRLKAGVDYLTRLAAGGRQLVRAAGASITSTAPGRRWRA